MDPLSLILTALIAGVTIGLTDEIKSTAAKGITEAYKKLKLGLKNHFRKLSTPQDILDKFEDSPVEWTDSLKEVLVDCKAIENSEVLQLSDEIIKLAKKLPKSARQNINSKLVGVINAPGGKVIVIEGDVDTINM